MFPDGCRCGVAGGGIFMYCCGCMCSADSLLRSPFHVALVPHQKMTKMER